MPMFAKDYLPPAYPRPGSGVGPLSAGATGAGVK